MLILMIGNNQFLYLKIPIARSLNSPDVYCFFEWDITPKFSWSLFWLIVLVLINCHGISNLTGSNFSDLFLLGVTDDSKPALAKITPKIKPWMTKKCFAVPPIISWSFLWHYFAWVSLFPITI